MYVYDRRTRVAGLVVHPQNIIHRALVNGLLTPEEARSHKVQQAAQEAAENVSAGWPEGEGFGTSDMTPVMEDMLNMAGIPTEWRGYKLERKTPPAKKEASTLDLAMARVFADAWSSRLIGRMASKFLDPEKLGSVLRDQWFDLVAENVRSIQWRSPTWMTPAEWASQMAVICPEYDHFHAGKVGAWFEAFPGVEVQPAREFSVCVYCKGDMGTLAQIAGKAGEVQADQVDFQEDGTLRLWWD